MKIKGYKPTSPNTEVVVIPRGDGPPIVFTVQAVLDDSPFDQLCPLPEPGVIVKPDKSVIKDVESPEYKTKLLDYVKKRNCWTYIQSLRATEGLEWETVNYSDPDTWINFVDELREFKLTTSEINLIIESINNVNSLTEEKMKAARDSFLASQVTALIQ